MGAGAGAAGAGGASHGAGAAAPGGCAGDGDPGPAPNAADCWGGGAAASAGRVTGRTRVGSTAGGPGPPLRPSSAPGPAGPAGTALGVAGAAEGAEPGAGSSLAPQLVQKDRPAGTIAPQRLQVVSAAMVPPPRRCFRGRTVPLWTGRMRHSIPGGAAAVSNRTAGRTRTGPFVRPPVGVGRHRPRPLRTNATLSARRRRSWPVWRPGPGWWSPARPCAAGPTSA